MADLHPNDHCDRHSEQAQFEQMVRQQATERLLIISDVGGTGKSSLLRKLQHNCSFRMKDIAAGVPSSLIELKSLDQNLEPFGFISLLVKGFTVRGQKFQGPFMGFNKFVSALEQRDFGPFDTAGLVQPQGFATLVSINPTAVQGGSVVGMSIKADRVTINEAPPVRSEFTPDQLMRAKERCVEAFFEDLTTLCAERPAVIFLDTWEGCVEELRTWIFGTMLGDKVFHRDRERRPKHLTVVIAGQPRTTTIRTGLKVSDFADLFDTEAEFCAGVRAIEALATDWEDDNVQTLMRTHGYEGKALPEEDVALFRSKIRKRMPLKTVVGYVQQFAQEAPMVGAS